MRYFKTFPKPRSNDYRVTPVSLAHRTRLQNWLWPTRQAALLTQAELAEKAGVNRRTIHAIETHKQWPSLLVALKLAAALDTNVQDLFKLKETYCCPVHTRYHFTKHDQQYDSVRKLDRKK